MSELLFNLNDKVKLNWIQYLWQHFVCVLTKRLSTTIEAVRFYLITTEQGSHYESGSFEDEDAETQRGQVIVGDGVLSPDTIVWLKACPPKACYCWAAVMSPRS